MRCRHRLILVLAPALTCLMTACGGGGLTPATSAAATTPPATVLAVPAGQAGLTLGTATVKVGMRGDNLDPPAVFIPATITVRVGDIVEWDYQATAVVPHNVTFDGQRSLSSFDLGSKGPGRPGPARWQVRFTVAGTYRYVCTYHAGMTGTVDVGG